MEHGKESFSHHVALFLTKLQSLSGLFHHLSRRCKCRACLKIQDFLLNDEFPIRSGSSESTSTLTGAAVNINRVLSVLFAINACCAVGAKPVVVESGSLFEYANVDPYDRHNDFGFNHAPSITRLSDGRLLTAWFSGPFEASVHQVILGCYGDPDGKSWGPGIVLNDQPRKSDFDPAFITDGNRTWMFYSVGRWNRYPFVGRRDAEKTEVGIDSYKTFARYTDDGGKTWSQEQRIGDHTGAGPRSNGIKLSSGELILPLHRYDGQSPGVLKSSDGGKVWRKIDGPKPDEKVTASEPTIAECASGSLLMIVRSRDGWLWSTRSADKGETWSPLEKSDMPAAASSHSLLRLRDGRLVLTHNPSKPPLRTPLTIRVSTDEGSSWQEPVEIDRVDPPGENENVYSRQVAYPSAIELPDGTLVVVWTRISISPNEQWGKIRWARIRIE
jgi:predicted neuraminidase